MNAIASKASPGVAHIEGTPPRRLDRFSVVLIAVSATLWASDVFFRTELVRRGLSSGQIVFAEDALITLAFLPVALRCLGAMRRIPRRSWLALLAVGVGPQAVATVLFTQSLTVALQSSAANETYLLQQIQPVIAVGLAWLVLKERRRPHFWPLAGAALVAVYLVVFANAPLEPFGELEHGRWLAAVLAVGAAVLWASGTVLGRYALRDVSFVNVTVLRFTLALPVLLVILLVADGPRALTAYRASDIVNLLALAALPGIGAILLYYRALRSTPASIATLAETAYPVMVTLLLALPAPYGFSQRVYPLQVVGTLVFVAVVVTLNADRGAVVAPAGGGRAPAVSRERVAAGST